MLLEYIALPPPPSLKELRCYSFCRESRTKRKFAQQIESRGGEGTLLAETKLTEERKEVKDISCSDQKHSLSRSPPLRHNPKKRKETISKEEAE